MDEFWSAIDAQLDRIIRDKPSTVDGVLLVLGRRQDASGQVSGFFAGSGGDRSLFGALLAAGWELQWSQASYYYAVRHRASGEWLTYIEGDVLGGNHRPLPHEVTS